MEMEYEVVLCQLVRMSKRSKKETLNSTSAFSTLLMLLEVHSETCKLEHCFCIKKSAYDWVFEKSLELNNERFILENEEIEFVNSITKINTKFIKNDDV